MAANSDCPICCEAYNKSTKTRVICEKTDCNFEACKACVRRYMLESPLEQNCMKCFRPWTEQFIVTNLNRSFVDKQLAPHRKQVILEKELARIPDTMEAAEKYKLCQEEEDKIAVLAKEIKQLRNLINLKTSQQYTHRMNINKIKNKSNEKRDFIMPCPNEDCRGFLSKQYFCSICKMHTCPRCVEIIGFSKNEPHTCDEGKVASAELIKKETKPCPACGERIFYVSGCDQMWCTKPDCHTAFSWKTGKIEKGVIHNPHYYQYLRTVNNGNIPRNPDDIVNGCGNHLIGNYELTKLTRKITNDQDRAKIIRIHRFISHCIHYEMNINRRKIEQVCNNEGLRIQYILGFISKEYLAKIAVNNNKLFKKYSEINNVFELFTNLGIEFYNSLSNSQLINDEYNQYVIDTYRGFRNIRSYVNEQFKQIGITYNIKVFQIDDNWKSSSEKFKMK